MSMITDLFLEAQELTDKYFSSKSSLYRKDYDEYCYDIHCIREAALANGYSLEECSEEFQLLSYYNFVLNKIQDLLMKKEVLCASLF